MKLTLGFSPCPNDTFIFDALVNGRIDTQGFSFDIQMHDVQTLNELAMEGKIDISKVSYGTLPLLLDQYTVLKAGSALGMGVGPLLISSFAIPAPAVKQCLIAIPGKNTTAHVLFSLAYPDASKKLFLRYNEIEDFVLSNTAGLENIGAVKLGVIIHENRFTYQDKGLVKQTDLGHFWEEETGYPVPLGGIVARKSLSDHVKTQVEDLIRESLAWSYSQGNSLSEYVKMHAQEMSEDVMRQHIGLYVNDFTMDLGTIGMEAVERFVQIHASINKIEVSTNGMFHL